MLVDQNHRFALLKTILKWEGRLNNARLREVFDLSGTRSSEWIKEFRNLYPTWVNWDATSRSYLATAELYQLSSEISATQEEAASLAQYLALVGISHVTNPAIANPTVWSAFPDLSIPSVHTFAQIAEAIRLRRQLQIIYRSMREPAPHQRIISPHSLVRAGRRWHVRAFCSATQQFRDYALGRMEKPVILKVSSEGTVSEDAGWNTMLKVRLIAHPGLNEQQRALVKFEYFAGTSARADSCRAALLSYYIQDVRAATDQNLHRPPEYQLAVENIEELRSWLF